MKEVFVYAVILLCAASALWVVGTRIVSVLKELLRLLRGLNGRGEHEK